MVLRTALAALAIIFLANSTAKANQFNRSDHWLEKCEQSHEICIGFILGFVYGTSNASSNLTHLANSSDGLLEKDQLTIIKSLGRSLTEAILGCNTKATIGQRKKVWIKYLNEHPELHHLDYRKTFITANQEAFPCE